MNTERRACISLSRYFGVFRPLFDTKQERAPIGLPPAALAVEELPEVALAYVGKRHRGAFLTHLFEPLELGVGVGARH